MHRLEQNELQRFDSLPAWTTDIPHCTLRQLAELDTPLDWAAASAASRGGPPSDAGARVMETLERLAELSDVAGADGFLVPLR